MINTKEPETLIVNNFPGGASLAAGYFYKINPFVEATEVHLFTVAAGIVRKLFPVNGTAGNIIDADVQVACGGRLKSKAEYAV